MRFFTYAQAGMRLALLGISVLTVGLTACGGSGNVLGPIGNLGPGGNRATVRFVNGSPDAGPVQVFIDNTQQFCTTGTSGNTCTISYGQVTSYAVTLTAGNHAIVLRDATGTPINLPNGTIAVNGGARVSLVLTGELHPSYGGGTPTIAVTSFNDQPFNTPSGGAAVNFRYASQYLSSTNPTPIQFGFFTNNNAAAPTPLGQTASFGGATNPQGIPAAGLKTPITFFAGSTAGTTVTPSQISPTVCSSNSLPCGTGNLSLYLIDGPAASTTPATPPAGVSAAATTIFVGAFD